MSPEGKFPKPKVSQIPKYSNSLRRVAIESPYAGKDKETVQKNIHYARAAMADCFKRKEAPYASHLLYTQDDVLDDGIPEQRSLGIKAGFYWANLADVRVVYTDLGVSPGMQKGIDEAKLIGQEIEYRTLGNQWKVSGPEQENLPF